MILAPIGPMIRPAVRAQVGPRQGMGLDARARRLFTQALGGAMLSVDRPEYLYQANDTTTPVTGYGQPVGRVLDQSGKGTHFGQSLAASRPIRQQDGVLSYLQVRTDDFLQSLANVDYSAAAYVMTVLAIRRRSDSVSTAQALMELGPNINTTQKTFALFQNLSAPGDVRARSYGTVGPINADVAAATALGAPALITMVSSIAGDYLWLKVNNLAPVLVTDDQGVGPYVAAILYLFSRAGTSNFADLDFYSLLQAGLPALPTAQQLNIAQLWTGSKMGVKP